MDTTTMNAKKTWTKPQLLVLVRSKPEEAVLITCKTESSGSSAAATANSCNVLFAGSICNNCASQFGS